MLYALLLPLAIVTGLGLLFGLTLAFGPWRNPQSREERERALESGACSHCAFMTICHMDYDGDGEECENFREEAPENG